MYEKLDLKKVTFDGVIWTLLDFFVSKGLTLVFQLLLARLLLPEHFGLIGMILIVIAVSQTIVNSGMQNALIREVNPTQSDFSTVFYFNLVISIFIYILIYIMSPFISHFYGEPSLTVLIRVLGIVIVINSLSIIQRTILIRNMNFKIDTLINFISTLVSGSFALAFAYLGYGVWSLILQYIVSQIIQAFLLVYYNKWFPTLIFSFSSFRHFFSFGWKLLVSSLINTIYLNIYNVIIGRTYNPSILGYYTQGKILADVSSHSITTAVQKVTYPLLSKIQQNEAKLLSSYKIIIKLSAYITFPLMIGLAVIAENLILVLLGEKWLDTVPFFQILCLAGMLYPLHAINLNMLQVKGRSDLFLKLEILKKLFSTTLIIIVLYLDLGIYYLIWTILISSIISFFINSFYSGKLLNYYSIEQLKDISKSLVCAFIMGVIVFSITSFLNSPGFFILFIQIVIGIVLYIVLSLFLKSPELKILVNLVKEKF